MKKRWIALTILALILSYYGVRHALWRQTPGFDGEFVFKDDGDYRLVVYKYGQKVAVCIDSFCRFAETRKNEDALYETRLIFQDSYRFDLEYITPASDMPKSLLDKLNSRPFAKDNGRFSPEQYTKIDFFLEPGPFTTCAWTLGMNGCAPRTKGSEMTPPKAIFDKWPTSTRLGK
jgi:hypothetical protein